MNIVAVNDAPTANAQTIAPTEDTTYSGTLAGTDTEGSALTYSVVSQGTKGVVTITNLATGAFTYVPNPNSNGSDSFTFKVNDGTNDSSPATVTVNIAAVNDAPTMVAGANFGYTENSTVATPVLVFDGANDSVPVGNIGSSTTFTVEANIKLAKVSGWQVVLNSDNWTTGSVHFQFSGNKLMCAVNSISDFVFDRDFTSNVDNWMRFPCMEHC
jgi:hypothetical protein